MIYIADQLARAEQIKARRANETLGEALAALDKAQARYRVYPTSSRVYSVRAARERVAAARAREIPQHLRCEELRVEWGENGVP